MNGIYSQEMEDNESKQSVPAKRPVTPSSDSFLDDAENARRLKRKLAEEGDSSPYKQGNLGNKRLVFRGGKEEEKSAN